MVVEKAPVPPASWRLTISMGIARPLLLAPNVHVAFSAKGSIQITPLKRPLPPNSRSRRFNLDSAPGNELLNHNGAGVAGTFVAGQGLFGHCGCN